MNPDANQSRREDQLDPGAQESGKQGMRKDDLLKRTHDQHPQREVPKVEDLDPNSEPPNE